MTHMTPDSAATPWDGVLVRFGEIGIKSAPVRRAMTNRLRENLLGALVREGVAGDVVPMGSRLWMQGPDALALAYVAQRVFGVVSVSPARRVGSDMESLKRVGAEVAAQAIAARRSAAGTAAGPGAPATAAPLTFAVRATREGDHPYTSQDIGIQVGAAAFKAIEAIGVKPKVKLDAPQFELHVEVRAGQAWVYTDKLPGPGGIPGGTQGKVVCLLSDRASFVAAWYMMRRGCSVLPVHAGDTGSVPVEAVAALERWGLPAKVILLPVCSGTTSKQALLDAAAALGANAKVPATALVTGDTLDSQLLGAPGIPVLRPLCGLLPTQVDRVAKLAGLDACTYPEPILAATSKETAESLLSMKRVVHA